MLTLLCALALGAIDPGDGLGGQNNPWCKNPVMRDLRDPEYRLWVYDTTPGACFKKKYDGHQTTREILPTWRAGRLADELEQLFPCGTWTGVGRPAWDFAFAPPIG